MPYFSIIVPVYNVAPYLREALDSVLAQTFTDWECLCVNDGSTDGSGAILDEYAAKDSRFKVWHKENGGVSSARNRGIEEARGKWIWFVDPDDMIHPVALESLAKIIRENSCVEAVSFSSTREKWIDLQYQNAVMVSEHSYESLLRFTVSASFILYRHNKIGNLRFPNYCVGEDGLFSMKYFFSISQWAESDAALYFYRMRKGSVMQSASTERFVRDWIFMLTERVELLSSIPNGGGGGMPSLSRLYSVYGVVHARLRTLSSAGSTPPRLDAVMVASRWHNQFSGRLSCGPTFDLFCASFNSLADSSEFACLSFGSTSYLFRSCEKNYSQKSKLISFQLAPIDRLLCKEAV